MPVRAESLAITERYRSGMIRLRRQGQREAKRMWRQVSPSDLDATFPLGQLELTVSTLQREAARLSSAYLSTFIASELGEPERPPALSVWDKTFNGNDLREGLRSAIVTAKLAIKDGTDPREATKASRKILVSDVGLFIDTAVRESLRQGMEMDDRIVGYQRALKGTCGACSGSTTYEAFSPNAPVVPLGTHPHCQCVAEPVVTLDRVQISPKDAAPRNYGFQSGQVAALTSYQEEAGIFLNRLMRGGPLGAHPEFITEGSLLALRSQLSQIFERIRPLGQPVKVYRGIGGYQVNGLGKMSEKLIGKTFMDRGFGSTSGVRGVAEEAATTFSKGEGMVWELSLDPGVKGIYVNRAVQAFFEHEEELLLNRNVRYVITGARREGKVWHVTAKVLPSK